MNEQMRDFMTKLLLTIPALLIGIFTGLLFILKPAIELWFPSFKDKYEKPLK